MAKMIEQRLKEEDRKNQMAVPEKTKKRLPKVTIGYENFKNIVNNS